MLGPFLSLIQAVPSGAVVVFCLLTAAWHASRALAEHWDTTPHAAMSTYHNPLNSIELFVLLDLLGTSEPRIPSYFQNTHWAYKNMASVESRMRGMDLLEAKPRAPFLPEAAKDSASFSRNFVEDDHVPFMLRGVPVLHMIPTPFPSVWHTLQDDGDHLDIPTVNDWAQITLGFVAEWMDLEGHMPKPKKRTEGSGAGGGVKSKTEL